MARTLLTSRWARRLVASLLCGVVLALGFSLLARRWGAGRAFRGAEAAWDAGDYRLARTLLLRVADDYPDHPLADEALLRAGRGSYLFLNDVPEAVRILRELARRDGAGPWARQAQRLLGEIFEQRQGDCRQAIVEYQRFIGLDPSGEGNDAVQLAVARCSFAIGDFEQARAEYDLLLERYPESGLRAEAVAGVAACYYVTGRYPLAVRQYRLAAQAAKEPRLAAEAGFGLASALEESGDLAGALREFERVRAGYPNPGLVEQRIARVRGRLASRSGAPGGA